MPHQTKIATCSYCGRRQTLQLSARGGHELACGACGAPLHEMKWLKPPKPDRPAKRSPRQSAPHGRGLPPAPADIAGRYGGGRDWDGDDRRPKKRKRRKSLWKKAFEEAFDVIEDIFD